MTEYALIAAVAMSVVLFVALFRRATQDAREEAQAGCRGLNDSDEWWGFGSDVSREVLRQIFSQDDEYFLNEEAGPGTKIVFRRERKRLALRWIERRKLEAAAVMRSHRQAARVAEDLQPSEEMKLLLRHVKLKVMCEALAVVVWLAGPQSLHGLAQRADEISHGAQRLRQAVRNRGAASAQQAQ